MTRKEQVIDSLVELSMELSEGGARSAQAAEAAAELERIISGLPQTSAEAGEMLALALGALRAAAADDVSDPSQVMRAIAGVLTAAARHLAGEDAGPRVDSPQHPVNVLRAILEAEGAEAAMPPEAETSLPGAPADKHEPPAAGPEWPSRQPARLDQ